MSNFEWASGEVYLPAAELATVKRELRNYHNNLMERAYDALKRFRSANLTSSRTRWDVAIERASDISRPSMTPALRIAMVVAKSLDRPRAVKWDDFILPSYSKAAVTETTFPLFSNKGDIVGKVEFHGRTMKWQIFKGNHAVDTFADSAHSAFLYTCLQKVMWTRGSGGGETYWNESSDVTQVVKRWGSTGRHYKAVNSSS